VRIVIRVVRSAGASLSRPFFVWRVGKKQILDPRSWMLVKGKYNEAKYRGRESVIVKYIVSPEIRDQWEFSPRSLISGGVRGGGALISFFLRISSLESRTSVFPNLVCRPRNLPGIRTFARLLGQILLNQTPRQKVKTIEREHGGFAIQKFLTELFSIF
jgi:hypothetical protein